MAQQCDVASLGSDLTLSRWQASVGGSGLPCPYQFISRHSEAADTETLGLSADLWTKGDTVGTGGTPSQCLVDVDIPSLALFNGHGSWD